MVGANIQPLRSDVVNGERRATPAGSMVTTSDTGEFRLWGLSPADYQVMVNPQRAMNFGPDVSDDRTWLRGVLLSAARPTPPRR